MLQTRTSRRRFLKDTAIQAGTLLAASSLVEMAGADDGKKLHVASNQYPWSTFHNREGERFEADWDLAFAALRESGLDGFEPLVGNAAAFDVWAPLLEKHRLEMRSIYLGLTLHDEAAAGQAIDHALGIARRARDVGTRIVVVNPQPLAGPGSEAGKTDPQLRTQAGNLDRLGAGLRALGMRLAYHFHAPELRHGAREFHHMMCGTDPDHVSLCLDTHWVYRGTDNSEVAVFDLLKLYAPRIVELHLRQSSGGTWTETFGDGDIDYRRLAQLLIVHNIQPHMVLEQAVEAGSPKTMSAVEAHRAGVSYTREVFADVA